MYLSDDTIYLRALEPTDVDFLFRLENDPETAYSPEPVSRQMLWNYTQNYSADIFSDKQLRLIICLIDSDIPIGAIDIYDFEPHNRHGYVGIGILPDYRNNGYGKKALNLLCGYASKSLGLHQLAAIVAYDNDSSRKVFTACGFRTSGRLRSWLRRDKSYADALIFQHLF